MFRSVRRVTAVAGLVGLGVALVVAFWLRSQRDLPVVLLHPEIPAARWQAYLADVAKTRRPRDALAPVAEAFRRVNQAEVAATGPLPTQDGRYVAAVTALHEAAWQFAQRRAPEELIEFGRRRGLLLADRLDAWLTECKRRGVDPSDSLNADTQATREYVAAGGLFVRFAEGAGFIDRHALHAQRLPMMQALFVHHWVSLLGARIDLSDFVRADEHEWLRRWRLEYQLAAPLDRRLEAADGLRNIGRYPADLNAGALLYLAGRYVDAARRLEGLTDPRAVSYRRMALRAASK